MTAVELVRAGVLKSAVTAKELGVNIPPLYGTLLHPLTALSFVSPERQASLDERFWFGCLAIQMVHEASICHHDVLYDKSEQSSEVNHPSKEGIGTLTLAGGLYLTGAYRVAMMSCLDEFLSKFIKATESVFRGKNIQVTENIGEDSQASYETILRMKSGGLFGIAAALPAWSGDSALTPIQLQEIGIEFGVFYQMVDDFLNYCPTGNANRPKFQDFHNHIWTFVLGNQRDEWFRQPPEKALEKFFSTNSEPSIAENALAQIKERGITLLSRIRDTNDESPLIEIMKEQINSCVNAVQTGINSKSTIPKRTSTSLNLTQIAMGVQIAIRAQQLGPISEWEKFFARNSLSFSFASRFFPPEERRMITEIYLFCRFTDNLVDKDSDTIPEAYETLDIWEQITHSAYEGNTTGILVADVVMARMRNMDIPFTLISELIEGMRMDVESHTYQSMEDLRSYTYRVASVVGDWITQAFGVKEPWVLDRAHDLGHAMQLTNIVRDVGEDLDMGRIYLPKDLMASHHVTAELLTDMKKHAKKSAKIPSNYIALLEEIMGVANSAYDRAYEGIPFLPARLRRAIAVAARVYRGIHDEIRSNGYNNLIQRAYTSSWKKTILARKGLHQLKNISKSQH